MHKTKNIIRPFIFRPFLSQPWRQKETGVLCRRLEPPHYHDLEKLAKAILSVKEQEFWYQLPPQGSRRLEWLLGRAAAKDAIRQFAQENYHRDLTYLNLEILSTPSGKPRVSCPHLAVAEINLEVSISHTQGYILAAIAPSNHHIGIDMERLGHVQMADCQSVAFTSAELKLLAQFDELELLGCWCAKEAAAKAMGLGLQGKPKQWQITNYAKDASQVQVTYAEQVFSVNLWYGNREVVAICQYSHAHNGEIQNFGFEGTGNREQKFS